jgi:hypothetical protein
MGMLMQVMPHLADSIGLLKSGVTNKLTIICAVGSDWTQHLTPSKSVCYTGRSKVPGQVLTEAAQPYAFPAGVTGNTTGSGPVI